MGTRELSETAYLICWGRSIHPELSHDPYAHLWLTEKAVKFSERFTEYVSPLTPYLFSLRSRYLIELLKGFENDHPGFTLINVGSGVTSYPFVLSDKASVINIDQPHVLKFYKQKIGELIASGHIPNRKIIYKPMDLNSTDGVVGLSNVLSKLKGPAFVLFEGILTYLEKEIALQLVSLCANKLGKGSQVVVHVFLDNFSETPVWKRIERLFDQELGLPVPRLTSFSESELVALSKLRLIEHVGYKEINGRFGDGECLADDRIIDERFFHFRV